MSAVVIGTGGATLEGLGSVRAGASIELSGEALDAMRLARLEVERSLAGDCPVYGINTGFGRLAGTVIGTEQLSELQRNLILSHACGTGAMLPRDVVRAVVYLRAASLARGYSGVEPSTVQALLALLRTDLVPEVPSQGSLGASGDLAPLAHLCLPLLGEGMCSEPGGGRVPGRAALAAAGLEPVRLGAKEGLALINGTPVMTAIACFALLDAADLADAADCAAALTMEALLSTRTAFEEELIRLRPHPGALETASNIRLLTAGSEIIESHVGCPRVQDAYSIRCIPQVHGACRDALRYVKGTLEIELASVTDNPLLTGSGIHSGGNFHGEPVALAADHLALAAAEFAGISERRCERLLNPDLSGLPAFLSPEPGLNSGYMIAQYTAAALVSENKVLAHPASIDSIPVSGAQEDHVSMGTTAARQALDVVRNSRRVIATELVCAAQAHEFLDRGRRAPGTEAVWMLVRSVAPRLNGDRQFGGDITGVEELISDGAFGRLLRDLAEARR